MAEFEPKKKTGCGQKGGAKNSLDTVQPSMVPPLDMSHTYEIEVDGRKVRCRTAEAASRLLRELGKEKRSIGMLPWTIHDLNGFLGRIGFFQRLALAELLDKAESGATDEELRKAWVVS